MKADRSTVYDKRLIFSRPFQPWIRTRDFLFESQDGTARDDWISDFCFHDEFSAGKGKKCDGNISFSPILADIR